MCIGPLLGESGSPGRLRPPRRLPASGSWSAEARDPRVPPRYSVEPGGRAPQDGVYESADRSAPGGVPAPPPPRLPAPHRLGHPDRRHRPARPRGGGHARPLESGARRGRRHPAGTRTVPAASACPAAPGCRGCRGRRRCRGRRGCRGSRRCRGRRRHPAPAHFLGHASRDLGDRDTGALCLLGCSCGIDACWPLLARVRATATEVTWSGFHQPHRPEWGELPLGPYVFSRPAYDEALATPVRLTQDPLAPLLGEE